MISCTLGVWSVILSSFSISGGMIMDTITMIFLIVPFIIFAGVCLHEVPDKLRSILFLLGLMVFWSTTVTLKNGRDISTLTEQQQVCEVKE